MNIKKFKKDKSNIYKVYFDNDIIVDLYDDVIIKYNLLINRELDDKKFDEIVLYNDFLNGYYKSIKYINKKLRSELEIYNYLKKLEIKNSDINKIIKLLYKDGYLNKNNYVKAYINDKYNLNNDGPEKVMKDLEKLGYEKNDFIDYLYSLDWLEKLEKLVLKRIKMNKKLSNNLLKSKIVNDLQILGYIKSDIINILDNNVMNSDYELLKKEYIKVKDKYSKKYRDKELEYKISNYLYSKGFNIEDIREVIYENKV